MSMLLALERVRIETQGTGQSERDEAIRKVKEIAARDKRGSDTSPSFNLTKVDDAADVDLPLGEACSEGLVGDKLPARSRSNKDIFPTDEADATVIKK